MYVHSVKGHDEIQGLTQSSFREKDRLQKEIVAECKLDPIDPISLLYSRIEKDQRTSTLLKIGCSDNNLKITTLRLLNVVRKKIVDLIEYFGVG